MMTQFVLEEQAKQLLSLFSTAEIEINGVPKQMTLTCLREGSKVRVFIDIPASEVGTITRRTIKNASGQICWADPSGMFNVTKTDTDLRTEIPIQISWKEGVS
ncbi:hypothetical protein [Brevibacillus centrosporus]|uniref:hypothetical protein n=1 Tax=Brevibacillus centrosporus TaxID=54910 RepID=UPI002E1B11D1|nr:hypothetical protein [Brevibacillus centrosporus]